MGSPVELFGGSAGTQALPGTCSGSSTPAEKFEGGTAAPTSRTLSGWAAPNPPSPTQSTLALHSAGSAPIVGLRRGLSAARARQGCGAEHGHGEALTAAVTWSLRESGFWFSRRWYWISQ